MISGYAVLTRCMFCGCEVTEYGEELSKGLVLRGVFICGSCEKALVNCGCNDRLYLFYVKGLKKIWRCTVA